MFIGSAEWGEPLGGPEADEVDLRHAWHQLSFLEREQERLSELRNKTEQELESCRSKGHSLEEVTLFTLISNNILLFIQVILLFNL